MLRRRYRPGWKPSWHGRQVMSFEVEDGQTPSWRLVLDAVRIADRIPVMLKGVEKSVCPHEVEITTMLGSPPLSSDPRNHCPAVFEVLQVPDDDDIQIMVMPLLRRHNTPRFETVGEALACIHQIAECVQFLHESKIAHRDIHVLNIMMDAAPISDVLFHPLDQRIRRDFRGRWHASCTRTEQPVKYFLIDFGSAVRYDSVDPPPMEMPLLGGDRSVPEFVGDDPSQPFSGLSKRHNPFPTDVYCLGNWMREEFLDGMRMPISGGSVIQSRRIGMEFLRPLIDDMIQADPSKRPSMDQVVERLKSITGSLSSWKLRSRLAKAGDHPLHRLYLSLTHWIRCVRLVTLKRPAIPLYAQKSE
ncbi:uncharacterized protein SCHCODRAFT_02483083 [Schizophyllum commune H4-8]|nr:uncharacterized protein SCHCODRAFT_02483083 [Schizophyllum commune H4-8]KAI5900651.1 hypothetical protein SCHCODRAFT_02483083 [Schizophyllum commune H4-8]